MSRFFLVRAFRGTLVAACLAAPWSVLPAQTPAAVQEPGKPPQTQILQQFFIRIVPPRPDFTDTMTAQERAIMQAHAAYWEHLFKSGKVLLIGPVLDPKGAFGMAVVECANRAEARSMADNDPSVKTGLNKTEVMPMQVFLRKQDQGAGPAR